MIPATLSSPRGSMGEEIEPQFKLWMGVWHCYVPGGEFVYAGIGYDKAGALEDWKRMQEKYRND